MDGRKRRFWNPMKPYVIRRIACKEYYCIFPPFFLRFRVDEREGFEYATCGRVFFQKRRKNLSFSKLSGQVWKHPRSQVLSPTRHSVGVGTGRRKAWERGWDGTGLRGTLRGCLLAWREEDSSTRKFLEGGTFRCVYMQKC